MPAPPPNGVSSTCPALRGVWSRKLTKSMRESPASTLRTWRCSANHPNHSGKRVNTSISIALLLPRGGAGEVPEEARVDLDPPPRHLDTAHRVADHRYEQRLAAPRALHLERLAGGELEH